MSDTDVADTPEELARQADAALREETRVSDDTAEVRVHEDHTRETRTPGFSRMRTEWHGPDAAQVVALRSIVDGIILREFSEAYVIMHDVYAVVREQEFIPSTGEAVFDHHGLPVWRRGPSGNYVEDFSLLDTRSREDFLFRITAHMFEWEQTAADMWGDAMFAKAQWEEVFSHGFVSPEGRLTVDDRTNRARQSAVEERYFAIFQALISRKAEAVVRSMQLLGQRLKDVLV